MKIYLLLSSLVGLRTTVSASPSFAEGSSSFVKKVLEDSNQNSYLERLENNDYYRNRRLERARRRFGNIQLMKVRREDEEDEDEQARCDDAFLDCLPNDNCSNCFGELYTKEIDWATVSGDTECNTVIDTLIEEKHCDYIAKDEEAQAAFCKTFVACALWDESDDVDPFDADEITMKEDDSVIEVHDKDEDGVTVNITKVMDCSQLEECSWEGYHDSFIGDGICHDALSGCYNSAICNYDGGDCCEDTCTNSSYANCGSDGFACKDPNSPNCDSSIAIECIHEEAVQKEEEKKKEDQIDLPACKDNEQIYRVFMYDSFGDGWDQSRMVITPNVNHDYEKFNDTLKDGSEGMRYVCLNKIPTCYFVNVSGGVWGNEISWEVKPLTAGAPSLAAGGGRMDCTFAVAGDKNCDVTCGKDAVRTDTSQDPFYKDFKDMYSCINDKCVIQVRECESIPECSACLDNDVNEYCYGMEPFLSLVDCTLCSCTERKGSEFCSMKGGTPGLQILPFDPMKGEFVAGPGPCSAQQSMNGLNAVRIFADCTNFDEVGMMVSDFDENNFGDLDSFEACAHSYADERNHGGHTALGCMQILVNSMNSADIFMQQEDDVEFFEDAPYEAIAALSKYLYHDAATFCDCAKEASDDCPICDSFLHFKTLLYESLDACHSLDQIDCDAWNEFTTPCKNNLIHNFGEIDFKQQEQCDFVKETCGGAGPFPAFRKLDCDSEIPGPSWDFYKEYGSKCLGHDIPATGTVPKPTPAPIAPLTVAPVAAPTGPAPTVSTSSTSSSSSSSSSYTAKPPTSTSSTKKPYVPPEQRDSSYNTQYTSSTATQSTYVPPSSSSSSSSSHWIRNLSIVTVLCGCGFYWYKKRSDAFSFVRYRRARNYMAGSGESEMYSSLSMDSGSSSFQPPTLPPTPDNMM